MMRVSGRTIGTLATGLAVWAAAPARGQAADGKAAVGAKVERRGDEIAVCGQLYHTTTPVVLWNDPGGYDAYRTERRFAPWAEASWDKTKGSTELNSPNRFGLRVRGLSPEQVETARKGWDVDALRKVVDQFVVHFDVAGTSKRCFDTLHDRRGLSVHFMLDLDGTVYQTLDLKELAWHATKANQRSIGIEVANVGAYPANEAKESPLSTWYKAGADGQVHLAIPGGAGASGERHPEIDLCPARNEQVVGEVQGQTLRQYDFTPQQYEALTRLTATLCTVFPNIKCDYPRGSDGKLVTKKLPDADYDAYKGVLGHYHVQTNKVDPGPAFQWDRVIDGARSLMAK